MRTDLFCDSKDVHLHIRKEIYLKLRAITYMYGATIAEFVEEVCEQICNETPAAKQILSDVAMKKAEQQLGRKPTGHHAAKAKEQLTDFDASIIYDLLEKKNPNKRNNDEDC